MEAYTGSNWRRQQWSQDPVTTSGPPNPMQVQARLLQEGPLLCITVIYALEIFTPQTIVYIQQVLNKCLANK
jgi:hypothetical protein